MKKHSRLIAAILAAASLCGVVSCGGASDSNKDTTQGEQTTAVTNNNLDNVPADLTYDGETITFYVRDDLTIAEFDAEETGDVIDDAVYKRNQKVMERLGVEFEFVEGPGANGGRTEFAQNVANSIMAYDQAYDIIIGYSMATASLAVQNYLEDLNDTEYIDLSQPWWSDSLLEDSTINGKVFVASGDIATSCIGYMYAVFFNKAILEDFHLEAPYELALNGNWTIDKMIEMSTGIYSDLNANGVKDENDRFGTQSYFVYIDTLYHGSDLRLTNIGKDGLPEMSSDVASEKAVSLLEKVYSFFNESNDAFVVSDGNIGSETFKNGNQLFAFQEVHQAISNFRNVDFDYGILPIPKYDEEQENYVTILSYPYSLYGIPTDARDADMSSAVMELMAAYSYQIVSPAYFEVALKVKYTSDDTASQIYDIIKSSICYDFGRIYNDSISGGAPIAFAFRNAITYKNPNWISTIDSKKDAYVAGLKEIADRFAE